MTRTPTPMRNALSGGFHYGFIDADGAGGQVFEVEVGIIAALREGFCQMGFQVAAGDLKTLGEEGIGKLHMYSG